MGAGGWDGLVAGLSEIKANLAIMPSIMATLLRWSMHSACFVLFSVPPLRTKEKQKLLPIQMTDLFVPYISVKNKTKK